MGEIFMDTNVSDLTRDELDLTNGPSELHAVPIQRGKIYAISGTDEAKAALLPLLRDEEIVPESGHFSASDVDQIEAQLAAGKDMIVNWDHPEIRQSIRSYLVQAEHKENEEKTHGEKSKTDLVQLFIAPNVMQLSASLINANGVAGMPLNEQSERLRGQIGNRQRVVLDGIPYEYTMINGAGTPFAATLQHMNGSKPIPISSQPPTITATGAYCYHEGSIKASPPDIYLN
jgi:hypothetical protein